MSVTTAFTLSAFSAGLLLLAAGARVAFRSLLQLPIGCRA